MEKECGPMHEVAVCLAGFTIIFGVVLDLVIPGSVVVSIFLFWIHEWSNADMLVSLVVYVLFGQAIS